MAVQIEHFKIFSDLAETKSFTLAGQRNGICESAVSQQLQALEKQFASRFAVRSNKMFRLTPEGEALRQYAREIANAYANFKIKFDELPPIAPKPIRLATTPYIGLNILPPCLQQFQTEYPQVTIQVEYRRTDQIYEDVLENKADLGFVVRRIKKPELEFMLLCKEPLVLICHPRHPLARKKTIRLRTCKGQTFISFDQGYPDYDALEPILRRHGVTRRKIIEFNDIEPIKRAVAIGAGIAIVPEGTVRREVAEQTLAARSIAGGDFSHPIQAVRNRQHECTPVLKQFIAILKKAHCPSAL
jgi:DNA-binding transcriptional LysR family regulator